jgi:hypothetical protein
LNSTHQALAYADDVNSVGEAIAIERNTNELINACGDIG